MGVMSFDFDQFMTDDNPINEPEFDDLSHNCYECGEACDCGADTADNCDGCTDCFESKDNEIADDNWNDN